MDDNLKRVNEMNAFIISRSNPFERTPQIDLWAANNYFIE